MMKLNKNMTTNIHYYFILVALTYIGLQLIINFLEWIYFPLITQAIYFFLGLFSALMLVNSGKKRKSYFLLGIPFINEFFFGLIYFNDSYPWGITLFNGIVFSVAVLIVIFKDWIALKETEKP